MALDLVGSAPPWEMPALRFQVFLERKRNKRTTLLGQLTPTLLLQGPDGWCQVRPQAWQAQPEPVPLPRGSHLARIRTACAGAEPDAGGGELPGRGWGSPHCRAPGAVPGAGGAGGRRRGPAAARPAGPRSAAAAPRRAGGRRAGRGGLGRRAPAGTEPRAGRRPGRGGPGRPEAAPRCPRPAAREPPSWQAPPPHRARGPAAGPGRGAGSCGGDGGP